MLGIYPIDIVISQHPLPHFVIFVQWSGVLVWHEEISLQDEVALFTLHTCVASTSLSTSVFFLFFFFCLIPNLEKRGCSSGAEDLLIFVCEEAAV